MLNPDEYGAIWRMALDLNDKGKPRAVQNDLGVLGASDVGGCRHRAVLTARRTPPSDSVKSGPALIGSALHEVFLAAVKDTFPERLIEVELTAALPNGMELLLHPDEIDPDEPSVTDYKFVADLNLRRKQGPTPRQRMQRALQGLAAIQAGIVSPEGLIVRNLFVSMHDADDWYVDQEPFDMAVIEEAQNWLGDVRYAVEHDEDGATDGQPYYCDSYCQFKSLCPRQVTDADNRITSQRLAELVDLALVAREERKSFERLEKEAVEQIKGVTGRTERTRVVSTTVHKQDSSYVKVDLKAVS